MTKIRDIVIILTIVAAWIVVPIAIFGVDMAVSISLFNPNDVEVDADMVYYIFGPSSGEFGVNITITTPVLGFMPKILTLTLQMYDEDDNPMGDSVNGEFPIGERKELALSNRIKYTEFPKSLAIIIKGSGNISRLGMKVLDYDLPPQRVIILH